MEKIGDVFVDDMDRTDNNCRDEIQDKALHRTYPVEPHSYKAFKTIAET